MTPYDPKVIRRIQEMIRDLLNKKKRDRSNKRFSEFVFVPDLCDPQESEVSAVILNFKEFNHFIFNPTFQDRDSELYFSTAVSKHLGCVKFERYFPPLFSSSAIQVFWVSFLWTCFICANFCLSAS